jgi:hypothetical protein
MAAATGAVVPETSSRPAPTERRAGRSRLVDWGQAVVLLLLFVTVFLWKPLSSGGYYAPGDLSQGSAVLRTTPPSYVVRNAALGDVSSDIVPWQMYDASEVRHGHLPLWNPYDSSGVPHLANGQAAPFSPVNAMFYVFSIRVSLVLGAAMVLTLSGVLTYGLARYLGLGHLAGMAAMVGYVFAGANVVWLLWPITAAAAFLPGIAWMACVVVDPGSRRRRLLGATGLAAAVGVSLLCGHPETTFYAVGGSVLLALVRLVMRRPDRRAALIRVGALVGGIAVGGLVAAVQIVPTFEYLAHRAPSGQRQAFVDLRYAGVSALPFVKGSPFGVNRSAVLPVVIPWAKSIELYMAAAFLVLALVGIVALFRRSTALGAVVTVVSVGYVVFIFNVAGIGKLLTKLPGLDVAMALRSIPLFAIGVALLAGVGIDRARRSVSADAPTRRAVVIEVLSATAVVLVVGGLAYLQVDHQMPKVIANAAATGGSLAGNDLLYVVGWLVVAVVAVLAPVLLAPGLARSRQARQVVGIGAAAVLLVALFAASGYLWRSWNPTVPRSVFYARSTTLDRIQKVTGDEMVLRLDATEIPPDMNLVYRVRGPENYDAIGIADYDALYRRLLHVPVTVYDGTTIGLLAGPTQPTGPGNLRVLGIRWVTTLQTYPFARAASTASATGATAGPTRVTVRPSLLGATQASEVVATSSAMTTDRLCQVEVRTGTTLVSNHRAACGTGGVAFSLGRIVRVAPSVAVAVSITDASGHPVPGGRVSVDLVDTNIPGLELAAVIDGVRVYRVPDAPPIVFSPATTVSHDPGNQLVDDPEAAPLEKSLVEASDGDSTGHEAGRVELTTNQPGDIRARVTRATPGWVVVMQSYFPGWKATVDGHAAPVARANGAFLAVRVPAGTSTVRFSYEPSSVRKGLYLTILGVLLLVAGLVVALWAPWRRRQPAAADEA